MTFFVVLALPQKDTRRHFGALVASLLGIMTEQIAQKRLKNVRVSSSIIQSQSLSSAVPFAL